MERPGPPWYGGLVGVAYRYFDLRMNVVPLFADCRTALSVWQETVHWWADPSIRIRFVETDGGYWFAMGAESQKPAANARFCRLLPRSEHYERFKRGHGGEAYLRFGSYATKSLEDSKKGAVCGCGHEAQDHDEGDGDCCLYMSCDCKKFSSFEVNLLKRKKTVTDIAFLQESEARDDPLAWNCLNANARDPAG